MKTLPLVLAAFAVSLAGCSRHEPAAASVAANLPPAKVRIVTVHLESRAVPVEITGVIRPQQHAVLAAKVMGAIEDIPLGLGQPVHAGDLLVKISAGEIAARVVQAQSQLSAARRDLDRERDLLTKGASTADMVKGLEDRFAAAQAMVREAQTMASYTEIRAPFTGVIARKLANPGDLASPGQPLVEIEGTNDFQVEAEVPDSIAAELNPGAELSVAVPATGLSFTGKLAELSSRADANAHTVLAKIAVPSDANVRSGQFARVQVPGVPTPVLLAPASAVSSIGQMDRVFVVGDDNHAMLRLVKTGARQADQIELLAGVDSGERVVVSAPVGLREGQALEVLP